MYGAQEVRKKEKETNKMVVPPGGHFAMIKYMVI